MSVAARSLPCVTRPTLDALLTKCTEQGVRVRWARLPAGMEGCYDHARSTIWLQAGDPEWVSVPVLLHEMEHARRGDDGHQSRAVERRIDETVAHTLITAEEYARAEAVTGARDSGAIAAEMGVPRWVVSAYRRTLRRAGQAVSRER